MLRTLFKHEMRATAKTFMWFYIAFIVIAVVNAIINPMAMGSFNYTAESGQEMMASAPAHFMPGAVQGIFMVLYSLSIGVIAILTLVIVILRFFRNLLGDEGYLMMTLPVTREQHILSKLFAAMVWTICTTVLIFLSFLMMLGSAGVLGDITKALQEFAAQGAPVDRWIIQIIVLMLIGCVSNILMLYAAMGVGPNLLKNRVGGSILAFIIIYIVSQFIMLGVVFGTVTSIIGNPIMAAANIGPNGPIVSSSVISAIDTLTISVMIGSAAIGVGCWFLTRFMLKRKLNLA